MSARDELYELACQDMPVTSDEVDEAINAYAHELAEKIRDEKDSMDRPGQSNFGSGGMSMAANLIDPEVTP